MRVAVVFAFALFAFSFGGVAQDSEKKSNKEDRSGPEEVRARIDSVAQETLDELFEKDPKAKEYYEKSMGYAVFNNVKVAFFISGGGGEGVAVAKETGHRTYMNMGKVGIGIGIGGQNYRVVFFFEDDETFRNFVNKGWQAGADAQAAGGPKGANAGAVFNNGIAVYQLTNAGVIAQADISGTKYWKSKKLNQTKPES